MGADAIFIDIDIMKILAVTAFNPRHRVIHSVAKIPVVQIAPIYAVVIKTISESHPRVSGPARTVLLHMCDAVAEHHPVGCPSPDLYPLYPVPQGISPPERKGGGPVI